MVVGLVVGVVKIEWILSGLEHEWLIECFFLGLECFDLSSAESHLVL